MKIVKRLMLMGIMVCLGLAGCGKGETENPYGDIVAGLGDEEAYAFLVTDNAYNVMVTSDLLYDEGSEKQAAVYCDVYYYSAGEAKKAGSVAGEGTAYPVTFSGDGIFAAGPHSVEKYAVSEKDGLLHLVEGVYENFDESANVSYTSKAEESETPSTEEEFLKLQEEYTASQIVHFSYGASGCVNEVREF